MFLQYFYLIFLLLLNIFMRLFLCVFLSFQAFFLPSHVFSANNNNDSLNKQDSSVILRNFGLGLDFNLSTIGPGGTVAFKFHKHWSVRAGFNYFNYNSEFDGKYFGYNLHHKPNLKLGATTINLDFFPSQHSSFFYQPELLMFSIITITELLIMIP